MEQIVAIWVLFSFYCVSILNMRKYFSTTSGRRGKVLVQTWITYQRGRRQTHRRQQTKHLLYSNYQCIIINICIYNTLLFVLHSLYHLFSSSWQLQILILASITTINKILSYEEWKNLWFQIGNKVSQICIYGLAILSVTISTDWIIFVFTHKTHLLHFSTCTNLTEEQKDLLHQIWFGIKAWLAFISSSKK